MGEKRCAESSFDLWRVQWTKQISKNHMSWIIWYIFPIVPHVLILSPRLSVRQRSANLQTETSGPNEVRFQLQSLAQGWVVFKQIDISIFKQNVYISMYMYILCIYIDIMYIYIYPTRGGRSPLGLKDQDMKAKKPSTFQKRLWIHRNFPKVSRSIWKFPLST